MTGRQAECHWSKGLPALRQSIPGPSEGGDCPSAAPATGGKGILLQEINTQIPKVPGKELELSLAVQLSSLPPQCPSLLCLAAQVLKK